MTDDMLTRGHTERYYAMLDALAYANGHRSLPVVRPALRRVWRGLGTVALVAWAMPGVWMTARR